jgi:hypothetical protein
LPCLTFNNKLLLTFHYTNLHDSNSKHLNPNKEIAANLSHVCPFQGIISESKSVSFQIPSSDECLTHAWHIHVSTVCNEMEVGIMIEFWINEGHDVREMQNCNLVI